MSGTRQFYSRAFLVSAALCVAAPRLAFADPPPSDVAKVAEDGSAVEALSSPAPTAAPASKPPDSGSTVNAASQLAVPAADPAIKNVAISISPLSLLATRRLGANIEYLVAKHHAIMVNPYYQVTSSGLISLVSHNNNDGIKFTNVGTEAGYRFYTGSKGANGFFVGPFLNIAYQNVTTSGAKPNDESGVLLGGGVDLGGQAVLDNGFTIGGGAGIQFTKGSSAANAANIFEGGDGLVPRLLFTVGYSF